MWYESHPLDYFKIFKFYRGILVLIVLKMLDFSVLTVPETMGEFTKER